MSFAIGFVRFREWQLKGDTIPKPVGLELRGHPRRAFIKHLSGFRQV
jgi:hypothetical protein